MTARALLEAVAEEMQHFSPPTPMDMNRWAERIRAIASSLAELPADFATLVGMARNVANLQECHVGWDGFARAAMAYFLATPQPSDPADADALKCNHRFKPNAGYPDCDCETEAECMYGATPPTAHPQAPSVDAAAVLALAEVCERKAAEFVKEDDGAAAACCDWFVIQLRALATQQAQPPTAQRHDDAKPAHLCPEWDYMEVRPGDPEMAACTCDLPTAAHAAVEAVADRYDPAQGVYDEASLRAAGKYWEALEYEANAREDWRPGEAQRLHRMQIAVERAMSAHDHTIDENNNYIAAPPQQRSEQVTEALLSEAVEVGTTCNLAAEALLDAGHVATADALSKGALMISKLAASLFTQPLPQPAGVINGDAVDDAAISRALAEFQRLEGHAHDHNRMRAAIAALHPEQAKDGGVS